MTIFKQLYELALGATLTLTISADERTERLTVNVIPKPKADHGEAALSTPLSLTATPEEFDGGFVEVLRGYRTEHRSLAEQAEATKELLQAAKSESAKKAKGAVAKASAKPLPKQEPSAPDTDVGGDDEGPDESTGDGGDKSADTRAPQATVAATEPQLFG